MSDHPDICPHCQAPIGRDQRARIAAESVTVEAVSEKEIVRGDTIWASNDGDWLLVDRIRRTAYLGRFARNDGSLTELARPAIVLRRRP